MHGRGGYVWSFGVADKGDDRGMFTDLFMGIGGEAKAFTVTALLMLADVGGVGLDDPVGVYVVGVPGGGRVTLCELSGMRGGFFDYTADPGFFRAPASDPQRVFALRQLFGCCFAHPALFPPGREFACCSTDFVLLGLVVEEAGGLRLGDCLRQNVLAAAGLDHTLLPAGAGFPFPHAQGYTGQAVSGSVEESAGWNPSWARAAGVVISGLDGLRIWAPTVATGVLPDGTPPDRSRRPGAAAVCASHRDPGRRVRPGCLRCPGLDRPQRLSAGLRVPVRVPAGLVDVWWFWLTFREPVTVGHACRSRLVFQVRVCGEKALRCGGDLVDVLLSQRLIFQQIASSCQINDGLQRVGIVEFSCSFLKDQLGSVNGIELVRNDLACPPTGRGPSRLGQIFRGKRQQTQFFQHKIEHLAGLGVLTAGEPSKQGK